MSRWSNFLNSLATRGGAIFLLMVINIVGTSVTMHLIHHGEAGGALGATLMTTFGNFSGALLMALKGSSESTATATVNSNGGATATAGDQATKPAVATAGAETPEVKP